MDQPQNSDRSQPLNPNTTPAESANAAPEEPTTLGGWLSQNATLLLFVAAVVALIIHKNGPGGLITWGVVILGLGFVIFIHELGHFLAAKWCDVHVTTFSIGFGPALPGCSFQRGETTYKIAALPLGGYVNMVGEGPEADEGEDYPRSFKNKTVGQRMLIISAGVIMNVILGFACFAIVYLYHGVERPPAVVWRVDSGSPAWQSEVRSGWKITRIGRNEQPYFDDMRMAVALSGADESIRLVFAPREGGRPTLDVGIEPRKDPNDLVPIVGIAPPLKLELWPESTRKIRPMPVLHLSAAAAARAIELNPDDELLAATDPSDPEKLSPLTGDRQTREAELARRLTQLVDRPISLEVKRKGTGETVKVSLPAGGFEFADQIVGATNPAANSAFEVTSLPTDPLDDSGKARDAFEFRRRLRQLAGKPMVVEVARKDGNVRLLLPPSYHWSLGLRMKMGAVTAIRKNSPAEKAGVQLGDIISEIELLNAEGQVVADFKNPDPIKLPFEMAQLVRGLPEHGPLRAELTVLRSNPATHKDRETKKLAPVAWDESWDENDEAPSGPSSPLSIPQLGLAYQVESIIAAVEPGSPADTAGLKENDRIDKVRVKEMGKTIAEMKWSPWSELKSTREGNPEAYDQWAYFMQILQLIESPEIEFRVTRDNALLPEPIAVTARRDDSWPMNERGLRLSADTRLQQAHGIGEALLFGVNRTVSFIKQIYLNLTGLFNRRISVKTLGGPIEIASQAFGAAGEDLWIFLLFLGIISVNLAVVNFLPIPVLDGGHMVFLIYEKLRGRPPSEAVRAAATYVGLAVLASLMIFVFYLDIKRRLFPDA